MNYKNITDKQVVFISGATTGIGQAIAEYLLNKEYIVYGTGRTPERYINKRKYRLLKMDVTLDSSVDQAVNQVIKNEGKIDILINCAGIGCIGPVEEIPMNEIKHVYEVNLFGMINVCKKIIPHMRKQKKGYIINISSIAGKVGLPYQSIYASTKFALEGISEALRIEVKPFGIRVCIIEPGDMNTNVNENRIVFKSKSDSPYFPFSKHLPALLTNNINNSQRPYKTGKLVYRILHRKNPSFCYKHGKFTEVITPMAKNILPSKIFERTLAKYYKIDLKI